METLSLGVLAYLANVTWEAALAGVAAAIADRALRCAPSRYRHRLWLMALAAAALLPLASLRSRPRAEGAPAIADRGTAAVVAAPSPASSSVRRTDLIPETTPRSQSLRAKSPQSDERSWPVAVNRLLAYALLVFYAVFLLFRLGALARAWRKTIQLRARTFRRELPSQLARIVEQCRSAMGFEAPADAVRRQPELVFSSAVLLPVTLGAIRPAIVLPATLVDTMDASEWTTALAHEMAHVRRGDYLLNLLSELFVLPISFHPAAIFLKRRIDRTRELATDELAARVVQSPAIYADALLSMARRIAAPALAGVPTAGYTLGVLETDNLEERIMKLMEKSPALSKPMVWLSVAFGLILLATTGLAVSMFSVTPSLQQSPAQASHQENTGRVTGVVVDPVGTRIAGAIVTLSNGQTNFQRKVTTNREGEYAFDGLAPGAYRLEVEKPPSQARYFGTVLIGPEQPKAQSESRPFWFPYVASKHPFIPVMFNYAPRAASVVVRGEAPPGSPPKPAKAGPTRIRIGGRVEMAKRISGPLPQYPAEAKAKGIQGTVALKAVISREGIPLSLKPVSSPDPRLTAAAERAVQEWRFKPTLLNGQPVEVVTELEVEFRLAFSQPQGSKLH